MLEGLIKRYSVAIQTVFGIAFMVYLTYLSMHLAVYCPVRPWPFG